MRTASLVLPVLAAAAAWLSIPAAAASGSASAPLPSFHVSIPSPDACVLNCLESAISSGGCSSITDISCVCTSTAYQSAAEACLKANCTAADLATAAALQTSECAGVSGAVTLSTSATASGSGSASASASGSANSTSTKTGTTSTSAGASTTKASGGARARGIDGHVLVGAGTALLGVVLGAGLAL
ncbi:uncharacterized protein FIBRA_09024 [Fibroporia radiculosa]|uniref:CFEM domain-containing protein n=1 Tax=Fibroporia radiculosa TaxID=599839 RepID=J4GXT3_9APHY|nr:uncharacterized protein FIBRA_09024 [Fibroporia radiculosa]CCM06730.1 predicted protein [Fibroporia radiculosa]